MSTTTQAADRSEAYKALLARLENRGLLSGGRLAAGWGAPLGGTRLSALGVNMYHDLPGKVFRGCEAWQLRAVADAV